MNPEVSPSDKPPSPYEFGLLDLPEAVSLPGDAFCRQFIADLQLLTDTELIATAFEEFARGVAEALAGLSGEGSAPSQTIIEKAGGARTLANRTRPARRELAYRNFVDNYLVYVADLIGALLRARPQTLRSSTKMVSVTDVLKHPTIDEFVDWFAEDTVNQLSFNGLGSVADFFEQRFGMPLIADVTLRAEMAEVIAHRNLLTHQRGVVDERFLRAIGAAPVTGVVPKRGERLIGLDPMRPIQVVQRAMADIDGRVVAKFGLQTTRFTYVGAVSD